MRSWIGWGLCAISLMWLTACRSATPSAAANKLQACEIALARHEGETKLDEEIRRLQQRIRAGGQQQAQQSLPMIERLGWTYVEKARTAFDPGYYKLAEQCAACLEARQAQLPEQKQPEQKPNASALLLRGHVLHSLHRFAEAESAARELVKQRGLAFDFGLLGDALLEQGKLDEAAAAYQRMMELKPGPQAYSRAAHLRWLKGDTEAARALMRLSAQASGQGDAEASAWAWSKLALYELQAGALKQAQVSCEQALAMQPNYAPALLARGRVLLAENKFEEAVAPLQQAARLNPLPEYRWTLADALRAADRNEEARQTEAGLNAGGIGDDPRTFALYLATRGEQTVTALKLAEEELRNRRDPFTLDALAWAQSAAGLHQDAQQTMQSALTAGTQDARLFLHAAVIAANAGETAAARRYSKQAFTFQTALLPSERNRLRQLTR